MVINSPTNSFVLFLSVQTLFVIFVLIFNLQRHFSHFCLSIQMLHGTFHLNGNMVEVTRNGKIPLFQIHYGFIEVLKLLIVFSYHQKNNLRTCLARSFEEVLPRKLQLNGKLKLLELNFFF